jgi:phosphatidylserine/phosphatidylglycerophosphate/cardiolipin synthase-like enzyme
MDPYLEEVIRTTPSNEEIKIILRLKNPQEIPPGVRVICKFGDIVTCRVLSNRIRDVRILNSVISAKTGRLLDVEPPIIAESTENDSEETMSYPSGIDTFRKPRQYTGRNTVIGIVDQGIDFVRPEFRNSDGTTRIVAFWNQNSRLQNRNPNPYGYGTIYYRDQIDEALLKPNPYQALGYHPANADRSNIGAHCTHVAAIAAGSVCDSQFGKIQGVAPHAKIIVVDLGATIPYFMIPKVSSDLVNLTQSDYASGIGDSYNLLEAIHFCDKIAGNLPLVVNCSMGACAGPHDRNTPVELAIDNWLNSSIGRAFICSGGNYRQARIHSNGRLSSDSTHTIRWIIDSTDITHNELEIWYSRDDTFTVGIRTPDKSQTFNAELEKMVPIIISGKEQGRIYHRAEEPITHDRCVVIFLYAGAMAGQWDVLLYGKDIVDGRYDIWIERDKGNPSNQSRLHEDDAIQTSTIGSICNGKRSITVGAFNSWVQTRDLASFSSCGFTRDGRIKPDIVAPGYKIFAARSTPIDNQNPSSDLVAKSGASMAAPHVAGAISLVFEVAGRKLSISETRSIILSSADKVYDNQECFGYGYLNIDKAIETALKIKDEPYERNPLEPIAITNASSQIQSKPLDNFSSNKSHLIRELNNDSIIRMDEDASLNFNKYEPAHKTIDKDESRSSYDIISMSDDENSKDSEYSGSLFPTEDTGEPTTDSGSLFPTEDTGEPTTDSGSLFPTEDTGEPTTDSGSLFPTEDTEEPTTDSGSLFPTEDTGEPTTDSGSLFPSYQISDNNEEEMTDGFEYTSFGSKIIEIVDRYVSERNNDLSNDIVLKHILTEARILDSSNTDLGQHLNSKKIYNFFVFNKTVSSEVDFNDIFEVVAKPGDLFLGNVEEGDLLITLIPGTNHAFLAFIASPEQFSNEELSKKNMRSESNQPGKYVHVIDGDPTPHSKQAMFTRKICDRRGYVPKYRLIVRIRAKTPFNEMNESLFLEGDKKLKKTFNLGSKTFTTKFLRIKLSAKFEGYGELKNLSQYSGKEYPQLSADSVTIISSDINLTKKSTIDFQIGKEKLRCEIDPSVNWTLVLSIDCSAKLSSSYQIGDWIVEAEGKLIINIKIGPNWGTVLTELKDWIRRAGPVLTRVGAAAIRLFWISEIGAFTALGATFAGIAFAGAIVALPYYMLVKGFEANVTGVMQAFDKSYAQGYRIRLAHTLTHQDSSELEILARPIRDWEKTPKEQLHARKYLTLDQSLKLIEYLSKDKKRIVKGLEGVHNAVIGYLAKNGKDDPRWDAVINEARLFGAAHALYTLNQFNSRLEGLYERNEVIKIGGKLRAANALLDQMRRSKGERSITYDYYDFIFKQLEENPGINEVQDFPLSLEPIFRVEATGAEFSTTEGFWEDLPPGHEGPRTIQELAGQWLGGGNYTSGNMVIPLIDGADTYKSIVEAIKTAKDKNHFIYAANWRMDLNFELVPGAVPSTKLKDLFIDADAREVEIRVLLSGDFLGNHPASWNITEEHYRLFGWHSGGALLPRQYKQFTNKPGILKNNSSWIIDDNFLNFGLHHQKILIIKGTEGLKAFVGGVDYAKNRLSGDPLGSGGSGSPSALGSQHDVHCKIEGPAAKSLLEIFINRWEDHPRKPIKNSDLSGKSEMGTPSPTVGPMFVKIATTFANGRHGGIRSASGNNFYSFAKTGSQDIWRMIKNAITQAQKYIYIEDQYLISLDAAIQLNRQLKRFPELKIILVTSHSSITPDLNSQTSNAYFLRSRFIKTLTDGVGGYPNSRVSFCYRLVNKPHNYVHAKLMIFDDELAIIGSANCNNRGYTHDSEVAAGIYDPEASSRIPFPKNLRISLWKEHLGIPASRLSDPVSSSIFWFYPFLPSTAAGVRNVPNDDIDPGILGGLRRWGSMTNPAIPDHLVDPRGN